MLADMNQPSSMDEMETDVCVVGAGPAGITFARECIGSSLRVCLLETGWFERDDRLDALSSGHVDSRHFTPGALGDGRSRQFGGTSNLWAYETEPSSGRYYARSLPPESVDFAEKSWQPSGGWPFSLDALRTFYARAQSTWNGGPFDYSAETWASSPRGVHFNEGSLQTKIAQHGSSDVFKFRYRDDLLAAPNIVVHLGATVVRLEFHRSGAVVQRAAVVRADGSTFSVAAKAFVLAAGGVENVQLLLLSDATAPGGPANRHHNVGRYVTDHPEFRMGTITPACSDLIDTLGLYDLHWSGHYMISGFLTLAEKVKRREELLNVGVTLVPQPAGFGTAAERSIRSLLAARRGERPPAAWGHVRSILGSPRDTTAALRLRFPGDTKNYREYEGGWSRPSVDRRRFKVIEMHAATEQTAECHNTITLSKFRDWMGRRQPTLRWRWAFTDQQNVSRSLSIIAGEVERSGFGTFSPWVDFNGPARPVYTGIHHPMGGTRIHPNAEQGVVDEQCRVHGTENLYVAGSSVFPTGHGYANPTLTLLALTIRLADHIKERVT